MKPTKLSIYFDMSDPTDVEKLKRINGILAGAPATDPAPTAKAPTEKLNLSYYGTDLAPTTEAPTREAPEIGFLGPAEKPAAEKPAAKEPAKEPTAANGRELDFPLVVNYQQVTQDLTTAIVSAVGADNPKSAANGAIIGTELKRLGFQKVSQMPDELKPALLEFIVKYTK
jgi:septal ring-binding cell division protein DamX